MSSSDLCGFDIPFHRDSSSEIMFPSYDESRDTLVFCDPFPFYTASPIDIAPENSNNSLDPFPLSSFPFVPSNTHLESQSLHPLPNSPNLESEFANYSALEQVSEVKSEESQVHNQHYVAESVSKFMQRSFSCNSFDGKPGLPFEANALIDSPNFQWHGLNSPEDNSFFTGQIRRVFSAGDLQSMKATHASQTESTLLEEANFKVRRYSAEERKEKISKYRAKRSQRKFNKTIKYACRKTLADNRVRIRGRFARNEETSVIPKTSCSTREEEEDEFWVNTMILVHAL